MRSRLVVLAVAASMLLLLTSCGGKDGGTKLGVASTTSIDPPPVTNSEGKPHFITPEAAMRYLASAWNANDLTKLKHVTNPSARDELNAMHGVAVNLRLNHCDANQGGDYTCTFDHDYPPHASTTMAMGADAHQGEAVFLVGPATTPGWYMTVFESCS